jgi:hypothetical protein
MESLSTTILVQRPYYPSILVVPEQESRGMERERDSSGLRLGPLSQGDIPSLMNEADQDSLFRNDLFATTCRKIRNRNEAMVIRDISLLIVPSAQTLAIYGATHLNYLIESVNEGWKRAMPFYSPRPQPDYSVGFGRATFKPIISKSLSLSLVQL